MATSTTKPIIHAHPLNGPNGSATVQKALHVLRPHLPSCIPVYRRLQFGRFFEDTMLLTNRTSWDGSTGSSSSSASADDDHGGEWIIAFVDRTCRPETEVWWFGSWEREGREEEESHGVQVVEGILKGLFETIRGLKVPVSIHQDLMDKVAREEEEEENDRDDSVKDSSGVSRADYLAHLLNADIVLCGAIHEKSMPALIKTELVKSLLEPAHARLVPNYTFVFDVDELVDAGGKELPAGLRWGELKYEHFAIVRARTQIPRQDKTLAVLPSLAIYDAEDEPVAWVFVGLDGSLTTLHVEEQWRGRGLAKAITIKLFGEKMEFLWEEEVRRVAHGYVVDGNQQSVGLCRSLGGKERWKAYWVRVDLRLLS